VAIKVQLRIYSGRRDPEWQTDSLDEEINYIISKLIYSRQFSLPNHLGYTGFSVININPEHWCDIHVYHEYVSIRFRNNIILYFTDNDRTLEKLLLEDAKKHVKEQIIQSIIEE
jgi:hypothetical protein